MAKQQPTNNNQDSSKAQASKNALLREEQKLVQEIYRLRELIAKIDQSSVKSEEQRSQFARIRSSAEEKLKSVLETQNELTQSSDEYHRSIADQIRSRLSLESDLVSLSESYTDRLIRSKVEMGNISEVGRTLTKDMKANTDMTHLFQDAMGEAIVTLQSGRDLSEDFTGVLKEGADINEKYNDIGKEIAEHAKDAVSGEYKKMDLSKEYEELAIRQMKLDEKRKNIIKEMNDMTEEDIDARMKELDIEKRMIDGSRKVLDTFIEQNDVLEKSSNQAQKTLGAFDKMLELDFKGAIREGFGLDKVQKDIKDKVGASFVNIVKEIRGEGGLVGGMKAAGDGLGQMIKMAPKLGMALGIGAILSLGTFLIHTFMEADKEVAQLGKDFGVSKNEAKELHHTAVDVANEMGIVGIHSAEVAKSLKTVSDNLGGMDLTGPFNSGNAAVQQLVKDTAILTEKFGLSGEQVGSLNNIAAITGKSLGEMGMMATKLGEGIFSAKESMKILSEIPPSVVSSMSKMPEAMIKTAQKAKLLGMSMKQIQDIGRKTLDIESSLEAQMEAQVLLGRNINLDKMRAAALDGDQETVMNEILNVAGSLEDFNDMTVIQKEALAKATGMEVDELGKMLARQQELNDVGLSQKALQELQKNNAKDLAKLAAEQTDETKKAFYEKLAAEKKSEETQASMATLMQRLQELAVKLVTPIMDVVDALLQGEEGAAAMDGILNMVSGTVKMLVPGMKKIASIIGFLIKPLTAIFGLFGGTEEKTTEVADAAKNVAGGVQQTTEKVKPLLSGFGSILGVVTSIGGFFIGKSLLSKGMDMLKEKAASVGQTIMTKVGGALKDVAGKAVGKVGGKIGDKLGGLIPKKSAGASIPGIDDSVGKSLDKADSMADKAKSLGDKIKDFGKGLGSALKDLGKGIGGAIQGVLTGLGKGLEILGKGLATMTPLGPVVAVVSLFFIALAAALLIATPALKAIAPVLMKFAEVIGTVLVEAIKQVGPIITATFEGIAKVISTVGETISGVIETIVSSVVRLADLDGKKLLVSAAGITAIAGALTAFGGGSFIGGLGAALGSLFDEDPVEKFNRFASIDSKGLMNVANSINLLSEAMSKFSSTINNLNFDKGDEVIEKFNKFVGIDSTGLSAVGNALGLLADSMKSFLEVFSSMVEELTMENVDQVVGELEYMSKSQVMNNQQTAIQPETETIAPKEEETSWIDQIFSPILGSSGGESSNGSMAKVEQKLDTLINVISQAANQPTVIKFGDKTIEEIKNQLNFRNSYNVGVDNTYARTV